MRWAASHMRITLATVPQNGSFTPLALLCLKSWLVERGGWPLDAVAVVEAPGTAGDDEILARVTAGGPAIVGFSCYLWNVARLTRLAAQVKQARPSTRVVLGGPEVGPLAPSVPAAHPAVDVVVRGEGEIPFGELAARWRDGAAIAGVRGIAFRDGDRIVETPDASPPVDVDELPSPHDERYGRWTGRTICLETQRGCVFRCNFCFYNKDLAVRNRRFGRDRVERDIAFWLDRDIAELYLMDPVFNLNAARAKAILRFIAGRNTRRVGVHAEAWAEFIDDEMARLMAEAPVTFLEIGLQTTDADVLATVERRWRVEAFERGLDHLRRHGVPYELHLIHGLPGETPTTFRRALDYAMSFDPPDLAVFPLLVLPGTDLWRNAPALRLAYNPDPPHEIESHYSMGEAEINDGRRISQAVHDLRLSPAVRRLVRQTGITFADVVDDWIAWNEGRDDADEELDARIERFLRNSDI